MAQAWGTVEPAINRTAIQQIAVGNLYDWSDAKVAISFLDSPIRCSSPDEGIRLRQYGY